MEQIILTNIDENKIDMEATGLEQKEIFFTLSAALIGYSKELGLTKARLNEIMSDLWKDDE